jgi:hypothetical protein
LAIVGVERLETLLQQRLPNRLTLLELEEILLLIGRQCRE